MTEGVLRKDYTDGPREAGAGPDGWRSDDADFADMLRDAYPPPSTEAGTPWILAFRRAVKELGAEVVQEPQPDPYPPSEEGD